MTLQYPMGKITFVCHSEHFVLSTTITLEISESGEIYISQTYKYKASCCTTLKSDVNVSLNIGPFS